MDLDEYGDQFGLLKPVMLSNVLQDIAGRQKEHTSDIGVIFNEYDASNLT